MFTQSHQVVLPNAAIAASRTFNKIAATTLPAACSVAFSQSRFTSNHRHRKRLPTTAKRQHEPTTTVTSAQRDFQSSSPVSSCMLPSSTKVAADPMLFNDAKALLRTLVDDIMHLANNKHAAAKTIRKNAFAIETKLENCVNSVLSHFDAKVFSTNNSSISNNMSNADINIISQQLLTSPSINASTTYQQQQFYASTPRPAVLRHLANTLYDLRNNSNISSPFMPSSSSLLLATAFRQHVRGFKSRTSTTGGRLQTTSLKQQQQASDNERQYQQETILQQIYNRILLRAKREHIRSESYSGCNKNLSTPQARSTSAADAENAALIDNTVREKYLKGDPRLSEEEQNRTKLAFLEGFVNAKQYNTTRSSTTADAAAAAPPNRAKAFIDALRSLVMFMVTVGIIYLMLTLASNLGSMKQLMGMSQHEALAEDVDATFEDVRGCDEAKDELREIVEYLKNPDRFSALGGRLPKGVLLIGPPGTGKTLLGRAVAGEAGVPFFHVAGSEFDEILVGQGARRVRDLFMSAKEKAPCVIFIDEIDAVGSKRTSSVIHPHANQTINQLLAEMDGFHQNEGVIVLGATNRREDLDKALTRPGRFDIEVHVPVPDLKGRTDIINYYLAKIRIAADVNADVLARGTTGFTGADLESMINQSALKAASDNCTDVGMEYIEHARDKVLMGPAKKSRIPDEEVNKMTAFHEAGHTLVAYFTEYAMPLHKVTIIPRGMSLGHTACLPDKETYQTTRAQMSASLDTLMGGRAAEELIFGEKFITSGAADDLRKASELVRHMVKHYGFSDKVGLRFFRNDAEDNSGASIITTPDMSPATQDVIDQEIRRLLQESYERAKGLLVKYAKEHKALAEALLHHETLDAAQIKLIIEGRGANMPKAKRIQ